MEIRPVDMYKAVVGWTEYKYGDDKHTPTHKLLSDVEWEQMTNYIDLLKKKMRERDKKLSDKDSEIDRMRSEYDDEIATIRKQAAEEVAVIQGEVDRQRGLNENLLRITRERYNAKRGIQPKKKHSGYRFIGKITQVKVVKERTKKDGNIFSTAWTANLETPYDVTIPLEQIKDRINSDLFGEHGICGRMHIHTFTTEVMDGEKKIWTGEYMDVMEKVKDENERNLLYDIKYSGNPKSKLWEVQIFTTGEIDPLPELL